MYEWVEKIKCKIEHKQKVEILEDLPIKKDLWLKNFVKSAISTSLIALAFNFIFNGYMIHDEKEILIGTCAFLLAIIVIFAIDTYHQRIREMELKAISNNNDLKLSKSDFDAEIEKILNEKLKELIKEDD